MFIGQHHLQQSSLVSVSLVPPPLHPVLLSFISLLSFLTPSVSLSPHRSCSLSSFFSPLPLYAAVTDFFFPRLKYEYFRAKKLKGNNETAPKLNYTPFPEPQKRDFPEWWAHRRHVGVPFTPSHTDKLVVSSFYVRSKIFPLILLIEFPESASGRVTHRHAPAVFTRKLGEEKFLPSC